MRATVKHRNQRGDLMSSKESERPVKGTVLYELWRFAFIANKSSPHPLDWRRFYHFIGFAHGRRSGLSASEVQARLRDYGFDERHAVDLAWAYWHGRCALHVRGSGFLSRSHTSWMKRGGTSWT